MMTHPIYSNITPYSLLKVHIQSYLHQFLYLIGHLVFHIQRVSLSSQNIPLSWQLNVNTSTQPHLILHQLVVTNRNTIMNIQKLQNGIDTAFRLCIPKLRQICPRESSRHLFSIEMNGYSPLTMHYLTMRNG